MNIVHAKSFKIRELTLNVYYPGKSDEIYSDLPSVEYTSGFSNSFLGSCWYIDFLKYGKISS